MSFRYYILYDDLMRDGAVYVAKCMYILIKKPRGAKTWFSQSRGSEVSHGLPRWLYEGASFQVYGREGLAPIWTSTQGFSMKTWWQLCSKMLPISSARSRLDGWRGREVGQEKALSKWQGIAGRWSRSVLGTWTYESYHMTNQVVRVTDVRSTNI